MDPLPHGIHFLEKIKGSLCLFFVDVVYINLPWRIFGSWRGVSLVAGEAFPFFVIQVFSTFGTCCSWSLKVGGGRGGSRWRKGGSRGVGGYKDPFFAFQAFSTFGTCCCWSLKVGGGRVGSRWSRGVDKVFKDGG